MITKLLVVFVVVLEILGFSSAQTEIEKSLKELVFSDNQNDSIREDVDLNLSFLPIKTSKSKGPYIGAEGVAVLDIETSKVLLGRNTSKQFCVASLTKIMTALVVLENYDLDEIIVVPKEATNVLPGATIYLREGEEMTVLSLLYGLLLYSGNDAGYTLASKMGKEEFTKKMNERAESLSLLNTHFEEATGLSAGNRSNVLELAHLTVYALRNPTFAKIVRTNETVITSVDGKISHPLKNTNKLLREYPGTLGGKTGYTEEAGHCLIVAVEQDGHKVVSVVLNSPSDQFEESKKILNWIFSAYKWRY